MRSRGRNIAVIGDGLKYNERKIERGEAERIYAGNFLKEALHLTRQDIRHRFHERIGLNQRTKKPGIKITISFSPADKLDSGLMARIAKDYMDRIGFSHQPYVVYRHLDTFTPHLHILSVNIRQNGDHIDRRCFGGFRLKPEHTAIEEKYGLLKESDGNP
jgi:hypothetical protein